jgi:hypothetical protein
LQNSSLQHSEEVTLTVPGVDNAQIITCPTTNQEEKQSSRDAGHVAPSTILVRAHGALTFLTEDGGSDERSSQALFDQEDRV